MPVFDPHSITQNQLQHFRNAAEQAWDDDTRHPDFQGHPQPSAGQCYVTARWLQDKLGGHVGSKSGHYFWVSPDKRYVIDLTGDQYAYEPTDPRVAKPLDEEDEPWEVPADQQEYRPGPVVYTKADHPLYKGFRVKEYPNENPRSTIFSQRADTALEDKLPPRTADAGGGAGDAYPGQEPQVEEDYSQKYFHDALNDLLLSQEEPTSHEYRWFFGNGQLHVSPFHSHDDLREHSGVAADDSGPVAAGTVNVEGRTAVWSAESNVAIRGLARELEDYSKSVGWEWGGLVRGNGESYHDDFGPKKSYWFGWKNGVQISERPFFHTLGRVVVRGRQAFIPRVSKRVREGLAEWADDFGYRLADVPGGGNMMDKLKRKEDVELYNRGNPDKGEVAPLHEGVPQGELTCPQCGERLRDFMEFQMHMDGHQPKDSGEVEDGHFPTIEKSDEPLQLRPQNSEISVQPLASYKEASHMLSPKVHYRPERYRFYGGFQNGQLVAYGIYDLTRHRISGGDSVVPGGIEAVEQRIRLHYPEIEWRFSAGQEAKDLLQAPIPFVYDVEQDKIEVGSPGQKSADVEGQFTPGGIVEGYYEPGGKMVITTKTSIPYTNYHLVQLWYWSHPTLEVTGVEYENAGQKNVKLAGDNVGQYIRTLASTDPAAWRAYQALAAAGGHVYVVGGAVRDALLQREPTDIDLMVGGLPSEEVNRVLGSLSGRVDHTGRRFGVYRYHTHGSEVEIALPRKDDYGEGGKRADGKIEVDHNLPVERDLERRDFTANSMAVDLGTGQLVDPYDGAGDIDRGVLRTTHPNSFKEDPSRLVRALTATSRFGLEPDERTRAEMADSSHMLDHESPDVLKQQLDKLMVSANPARAFRLAQSTGILSHLFPELAENFDYNQNNKHHSHTLGEHSLNVLDNMARLTPDPDLRLAALLHDIGKPASAWHDPDTGESHFYPGVVNGQRYGADHATMGANMTEARLRQTFNYPVARMRRIHKLIDAHMFGNFSSPRGARKFLHKHGEDADDLLTLRECDNEGKGTDVAYKTPVEDMRGLVDQQRQEGAPTAQSALALNGNDLLQLGLKPGPQVGTILRQLTNDVVEEPKLNDPQQLRERATEYINAQPA